MSTEERYDIVIIGAGHNGTTAAAYLAALETAHGHFQGMGVPAFCGAVAFAYFDRAVGPRGNMHGYYHAILRCAIAHGAVVRTCCPVDEIRDEINGYMRRALSQVVENVDSDNVVNQWAGTPYDSEFRNTGLMGGSWYGIRPCRDQWWTQRPLPDLARYRTPIDGLYLCHQTSGHPGGLCLMAIPYNLMHILIEDGVADPGDWWYPSPWYIPQQGKRSAIPR